MNLLLLLLPPPCIDRSMKRCRPGQESECEGVRVAAIVAIVAEAERRTAMLRLTSVILRISVIVFEFGRINDVLE